VPLSRDLSVLALGLPSHVLVCFLRPELRIAHKIARHDTDGANSPSLAW
jgi:hypothetical protein